jgi:hypothetical protein
MAEPIPHVAEPPSFGVEAEQYLGHPQADEFGVGEPGWSARSRSQAEAGELIVDFDVQCNGEGVELCLHKPMFAALALSRRTTVPSPGNSASTI